MGGINSDVILIVKGGVGGTIYDAAYSGHGITNSAAVVSALASAYGGQAIYFAGTNQRCRLSTAGLDGWWNASQWTLDWRMQITQSATNFTTLRLMNFGSTAHRVGLYIISTYLNWYMASLNAAAQLSVEDVRFYFSWVNLNGSFHHYAICVSAHSTARWFLDGSLMVSQQMSWIAGSLAGNNTTNSFFYLGDLVYTTGVSSFQGYVDEFRITKGVCLWTANFTPPTEEYTYDLPVANIQTLASNVQPLWVANQSLQIANRFRYDTVRKIPDMSAAQVRAVLMSAGYTFDPDADHDFDSVSAHSIASVRLYPTITEDDTSDITSVYFSDIPFSGSASTVGMAFTVAKDFYSVLDSRIICLLHGDGTDGGTTFTDSAKSKSITTGGSGTLTTASLTKKFGTAAIRPSTTSTVAFLSLSYHSDFCLGSVFTLDMWLYWSVLPVGVTSLGTEIYWCLYSTEADRALLHANWWSGNSMTLVMKQVRNNSDPYWIYSAQAGIISVNSWYHFAFCRNGSVDYAFKNGSLLASTLTSYATGASAGTVSVYTSAGFVRFFDRGTSTMPCRAICDEFRIMKGYCAWTSDFTLYAEAYAESAIWSGETIIGFLSINETIPVNETLTAKGVSVRLT